MDVFYFYDTYRARDEVKEIIEMIRTRAFAGGNLDFQKSFRTLMNPFRAKVANYLQGGGWMRRGCGRIWAEGAGGIKSGAGGWGEALAVENGWLRMSVKVSGGGRRMVA